MSPQHAADLWKQYLEPLADKGVKLISPATSSAPAGKTWMKDFFAACDGCRVGCIKLASSHVSDSPIRSAPLPSTGTTLTPRRSSPTSTTSTTRSASRSGSPSGPARCVTLEWLHLSGIVLTIASQNFNGGAQCSNDEVWNMMTTVTKYMESQDWVQQYFAFG